jgi:hypothetical protein
LSFQLQKPVTFPEIALNPKKAKPVIAAAKLDISRGSAPNKKVLLRKAECEALGPIAINVTSSFIHCLIAGGKIGHIARNCPMNEGGYGGGFGGQGYNESAKTCYACGGFGILPRLSLSNT